MNAPNYRYIPLSVIYDENGRIIGSLVGGIPIIPGYYENYYDNGKLVVNDEGRVVLVMPEPSRTEAGQ